MKKWDGKMWMKILVEKLGWKTWMKRLDETMGWKNVDENFGHIFWMKNG
jgi:hypothetical protein